MLRDGYAAVTSRRLETETGLKVHYHFGSIDDLFIAAVRRRGEVNLALMAEALSSAEPLRAWWRLASDRRGSRLLVEITAAANHRPALQVEVAAFARETRRLQIEALDHLLDEYGIDRDAYPPSLVAPTIQGLAFAMAYDQAAGFDTAQDEASLAMDQLWIVSSASGQRTRAECGQRGERAPVNEGFGDVADQIARHPWETFDEVSNTVDDRVSGAS